MYWLSVLDVETFERLLGPCMEIMKRNIDDYEEQLVKLFGDKSNLTDVRWTTSIWDPPCRKHLYTLPFSLETFLPGWKPQIITYPVFSLNLYRWKLLTKFCYTTTELYCFNFFFLIISIIFNFLLQGTVKFKKYGFLNGKSEM